MSDRYFIQYDIDLGTGRIPLQSRMMDITAVIVEEKAKLAAALAEVERLNALNTRIEAHDYDWAHHTQALLATALDRANAVELTAGKLRASNQALESANRELKEKLSALCLAIDEYDRLTAPSRLVEGKELLERLK